MAHFDVDQRLRAHTRRTIETYAADADRLIVVSTSGLDEESIAALPVNCEFVSRPNFGYDFFSFKWGLDLAGDLGDFDHVVVSNDSFIGPTVSLRQLLQSDAMSDCDLMGLTLSQRHGRHVQSFFFAANEYVVKSKVFRSFFKDMRPVTNRMQVIQEYEVGFSGRVSSGGFKLGSYFTPTAEEVALGARRWAWHRSHRLSKHDPSKVVSELDPHLPPTELNPAIAYADRVLLEDRLPFVKIDTLRFDSYALSSSNLLRCCEAKIPDHVEGVREFLDVTRERYPFRPGEMNIAVRESVLEAEKIGYGMDRAFSKVEESEA